MLTAETFPQVATAVYSAGSGDGYSWTSHPLQRFYLGDGAHSTLTGPHSLSPLD